MDTGLGRLGRSRHGEQGLTADHRTRYSDRMRSICATVGLFLVIVLAAQSTSAQARRPAPTPPPERPLPAGQEIYARDGDRVIIEDAARVRVITRYTGTPRTVYNPDQHWLIVMVDFSSPENGAPDGKPDVHFNFNGLIGEWPMDARWEGFGSVDQYSESAAPFRGGIGIMTPIGLIQIFSTAPPIPSAQQPNIYPDPAARAVLQHRGFGIGRSIGTSSFDQMEQGQVASATRMAQNQPMGSMIRGVGGTVSVPGTVDPMTGLTGAPVRVGGNVAVPQKIVDVAPLYPEVARRADVKGIVILEVTVGVDGSVSNVRPLRSIPLLDQAALEAVRQWRYSPTIVNGQSVPVVLTVTVPFPPQ